MFGGIAALAVEANGAAAARAAAAGGVGAASQWRGQPAPTAGAAGATGAAGDKAAAALTPHEGEMKVEANVPQAPAMAAAVDRHVAATIVRMLHLLHPVRPHRLLQRLLLNLCQAHPRLRLALVNALVSLADADRERLRDAVMLLPPPPAQHGPSAALAAAAV
ncbi:unnamed protein product, partial [Phaeothamnion confervicola]